MIAKTFSAYVARRFVLTVVVMLAALSGLVALFDLIELLRRAATRQDVGLGLVLEIAALRVPFVALQILPFAVLIGGIIAFWRLTRSSELIVARAAGISAWGFLAAPVLVALAIGVLATTAISPLSSMTLARAERLDGAYLRNTAGVTAISGGRLWLRQSDHEQGGVVILSGEPTPRERGALPGFGGFELTDVSIWRLTADDRPIARIEAPAARLMPGHWALEGAVIFPANHPALPPRTMELPTELTPARIEDSFASPDTLGFWSLPAFIKLLDDAGFSAVRHRLRFQSLLALPLLTSAMALLAAGFSMRHTRRGGTAAMMAAGIAAGFALFMLDRITSEFGQAGTIPIALAAWAPAAAGMLSALALLLHLEDG